MFERDYLLKVRSALHAAGIWGNASRRLTEQLGDHYHETVTALKLKGRADAAAQKEALEILGSPESLANAASESLREQSVLARHPWWMSVVAFLSVFAASFLIMFLGYHLSGIPAYIATKDVKALSFTTLAVFAFLTNWLPFAMSIALLGWTAWKKPTGWKPLLIVCAAIGVATGALTIQVTPPAHGYGSGSLNVASETWAELLAWPLIHGQNLRIFLRVCLSRLELFSFVKLLLPSAICLALRFALQRRNSTRDLQDLSLS